MRFRHQTRVIGSNDITFRLTPGFHLRIGLEGEGTLRNPRGVFVTKEGNIFVADRDAGKIFIFNNSGELIDEYGKPSSPLYGDEVSFLPIKIAVNDADIMFVVCESNTNGIVEISPTDGGTFLGYFGTNYAATSLSTIIFSVCFTILMLAIKMMSRMKTATERIIMTGINAFGILFTLYFLNN